MLQTEYEFTLPKGYIDGNGTLHRNGTMRLATAADEILPLRDTKVQQNPEYLGVILLSRVITKLGSLERVDTKTVESFFTADMAYLQDLYQRINQSDNPSYKTICPKCKEEIEVSINFMQAE